jgi:hypothetical protein
MARQRGGAAVCRVRGGGGACVGGEELGAMESSMQGQARAGAMGRHGVWTPSRTWGLPEEWGRGRWSEIAGGARVTEAGGVRGGGATV